MSQIFEALRRAEAVQSRISRRRNIVLTDDAERRRSERRAVSVNIRIYGYGRGRNPFFEENPVLNAGPSGALMLMKTPVVAGQKLLLINEAAAQVQECRVVRTSCRNSQEVLEVAVEFPSPQPGFWHCPQDEDHTPGAEKRKLPRIALPRGMNVIWKGHGEPVVSTVQDLSAGGLSIVTPEAPAIGELLQVSFEVPAGEVSSRSVVRHSRSGVGMGIEFVAMSDEGRTRLDHLLQKLLP